jgi:hypothetical protein
MITWLVSILEVSSLHSDFATWADPGSVGELCPLELSSVIGGRFARDIVMSVSPSVR